MPPLGEGTGRAMELRDRLRAWPVLRQLRDGDLLGTGQAAESERSRRRRPRIADADHVARSICPYCAVGCAQLAYVKDGEVIQVEGDPASPISRGRLCPKGSASKSLHSGPLREYRVKYRRPYGTRLGGAPARPRDGHDRRPHRRHPRGDLGGGRPRTATPPGAPWASRTSAAPRSTTRRTT